MTFSPIIPVGGLGGWNFLNRTIERQTEVFDRSPEIVRDLEYFSKAIKNVSTLDDFMSDRRILKVALGSVGLSEEINKSAFVRKILEEGTGSGSFARRLGNTDYVVLAEIFSFSGQEFKPSDEMVEQVSRQYKDNMFEESLGEVDNDMRLALNFKREISNIADLDLSQEGGWFRVLGSLPLRAVMEDAFNLPGEFSQIDLDKQVEVMSDKAKQIFGSSDVKVFRDPQVVESAIQKFQLKRQIEKFSSTTSSSAAALSLLSGGLGSAGIENLISSSAAA